MWTLRHSCFAESSMPGRKVIPSDVAASAASAHPDVVSWSVRAAVRSAWRWAACITAGRRLGAIGSEGMQVQVARTLPPPLPRHPSSVAPPSARPRGPAFAGFPACSPRVSPVLRLFGILATVLFAIAAAVLTWPPFFRLERTYPIAQIISFRGLVVVGFAAVVLVALMLAMWRPVRGFALSIALVAGLAVIANVSILVSRGLGADTLPSATATSVRVMTWNTAGEATPAGGGRARRR